LPPVWIDIQEDIDDNIISIQHLMKELGPLRQQRFGAMMFDDQGAMKLDEKIADLVKKITGLIRKSESKLKEMSQGDAFRSEESDLENHQGKKKDK
jgi:gas vesicle protein